MRGLRPTVTTALSLCALGCFIPSGAGAYATIAPAPVPSASTGLPDGRVYEEASPPNKHGYQAGAIRRTASEPLKVSVEFALASQNGNAVAYRSVGPASETNASGLDKDFVAERTVDGWKSHSMVGRGLKQTDEFAILSQAPRWQDYSPDLSHLAYITHGAQVQGAPNRGFQNIYLLGSDPLEEPTWLLHGLSEPPDSSENPEIVGMSPSASVVYFAYDADLLPQDASRPSPGWGLYEYRNGTVSEAGVLPDGSVPAANVLPMATAAKTSINWYGANNPASLDNQLSENGMRVFFVCEGQLYVHEIEPDGSERSVLVSASQLPGHVGEAAPDGVELLANLTRNAYRYQSPEPKESSPTYGYASSDGSHVFFQSDDQLTSDAPAGAGPKLYDFDVDSGSLEYLPGVVPLGIVAAARDGSSFAFVDATTSPEELDLWSAGVNGGSVTRIAQLPGGGDVGPARMPAGGSVLVFQASAPIAGFNNAGSEQVYRYDVAANELSCISCPPAGVAPSGNAYLSAIDQFITAFSFGSSENLVVNDARGVSNDGRRVFFASPDPLVGRDTDGDYDTYEWEDGKVFLISTGTSANYSLFLDNSETGSDVFFATSDELVEGDNDAGFDVYDARIPHPGDNPPPAAVPCTGDVCQGPPSVPQLLGAPPSATFDGVGNVIPEPVVKATNAPKRLTSAQRRANALRACRKLRARHKRTVCEKQARKRYPAKGASVGHDSRRGK